MAKDFVLVGLELEAVKVRPTGEMARVGLRRERAAVAGSYRQALESPYADTFAMTESSARTRAHPRSPSLWARG